MQRAEQYRDGSGYSDKPMVRARPACMRQGRDRPRLASPEASAVTGGAIVRLDPIPASSRSLRSRSPPVPFMDGEGPRPHAGGGSSKDRRAVREAQELSKPEERKIELEITS